MFVSNYQDYLFNKEMINWEMLSSHINEQDSWEDLFDKIWKYLEKAASKGDKYLAFILSKIFGYFKQNPRVLLIVVTLLVTKFHFTKKEVIELVPEDTIVSAEELYAKSMDDKGLPEDYDVEKGDINYYRPLNVTMKKFLTALADKESTNDPEKVNTIGYMGKYQFGEIALKDILKKQPSESDEDYEKRIRVYWPKNFGKLRTGSDFRFFQSKFSNNGTDFWPEHKQDLAMKQLLKNNKAYLGDYIDKWVGKSKKGVKITLSGLLAGAHLLGPSNVKKFLDQGVVAKDGYGTPITEYIEKFGGYSLPL